MGPVDGARRSRRAASSTRTAALELVVEHVLRQPRMARRVLEVPAGVAQVGEPHRHVRLALLVVPLPGDQVEVVVRQEQVPVERDQVHRRHDVAELRVGDEVVEVHARPAGLERDEALSTMHT